MQEKTIEIRFRVAVKGVLMRKEKRFLSVVLIVRPTTGLPIKSVRSTTSVPSFLVSC